jgi:DNA modification methylase
MKKTKTSSFGSGKREGHDASAFYSRNLYESNGIISDPLSPRELNDATISPIGLWANQIYHHSSVDMNAIPGNSVGLAFTSPPYNVGKDYDEDMGLKQYLQLIEDVAAEVYRVLRPGGRYVINVANLGRKPYIPLHSFFYTLHIKIGFLPMGEIIWRKAKGASGNCAWGSWRNAKAPRLRDIHEYLLVFAKQSYNRPDSGITDISPSEFMDATLSVWDIPSESARRVRHPAPFPVQLAERVIELYSYVDDVVLDPFVGSGSTCVAAVNKRRQYVGFDISEEYCELARTRIQGKGKLYMPSEKTESSELSLAFGVLGINEPISLSEQQVLDYFENTLSVEKYRRFQREFSNPKNTRLYSRLIKLGGKLRENYPHFTKLNRIKWLGPQKQARTDSGVQDLSAANISISVKAGSNILFNLSPSHIFESMPQGSVPADRSENWFLRTNPGDFQDLYASVRDIRLDHLPASATEFEHTARSADRDELQSEIAKLTGSEKAKFESCYKAMCRKTSEISASMFNENYKNSMSGGSKNAVIEYLVRNLFRLDSVEYILAGIAGSREYVIKMPSLSHWKREWEIVDIQAHPDLSRKQSVVLLTVCYKNKQSGTSYNAQFHIEIRWSHRKFCGAPEAKLYKDFNWKDIAFVTSIV